MPLDTSAYSVLLPRDLDALERLAESSFTEEMKDYLLDHYDAQGYRMERLYDVFDNIDECEQSRIYRGFSFCMGCGECGISDPILCTPLLELIIADINDAGCGALDLKTGERHKPRSDYDCF